MANLLTRIGFIDETSVKTSMAKTTGWVPRGQRLIDHAPFGSWQTQTFIAALRHDRLDAPWVIDGPINRDLFDLYIETQLAPTLQPGDVIILDNLSVHKSPKAAQILKDIGGGDGPAVEPSLVDAALICKEFLNFRRVIECGLLSGLLARPDRCRWPGW